MTTRRISAARSRSTHRSDQPPRAELSIAGFAVLYGDAIMDHPIVVEHLCDPECRTVVETVVALHARGEPIGIDTIAAELQAREIAGLLRRPKDGGGSLLRLDELAAQAANSHTIVAHLRRVAEAHARRSRIELLEDVTARVERGEQIDATVLAQALAPAGRSAARWMSIADVAEEEQTWLWDRWLPAGELAIIEGPPKGGKSSMLRTIAAAITCGLALPGQDAGEATSVVWISTEEHTARRLRPCLRHAGADLLRVIVPSPGVGPWSIAEASELQSIVEETGARVVVIDAIKDTLRISGEEREIDVRAALQRLQAIAHATGCTVIGVRHWRKGASSALERGSGSIGYAAIAGVVIAVARHRDHGAVVGVVASRCGEAPQPRALRIVGVGGYGVAEIGDEVDVDLDDVARDEGRREPERAGITALALAVDALRSALADGPRPKREIEVELAEEGHTPRTLQRAAKMLGVESDRLGFGGAARWRLAAAEVGR